MAIRRRGVFSALMLTALLCAPGCGEDPAGPGKSQADAAVDAGEDTAESDAGAGGDAGPVDTKKTYDKPTVQIVKPTDKTTVKGIFEVEAKATAAKGLTITQVALDLDGKALTQITTPPYLFKIDSSVHAEGDYKLGVTAIDSENQDTRVEINITIDRTGPQLAFTAPLNKQTVSGDNKPIELKLNVGAEVPSTIAFSAVKGNDVVVIATKTEPPWQASWNTAGKESGAWTLRAIGKDAHGNQTTAIVDVTLNRGPTAKWSQPSTGSKISGSAQLVLSCEDDLGLQKGTVSAGGKELDTQTTLQKKTAAVTFTIDTTALKAGEIALLGTCTDTHNIASEAVELKVVVDQPAEAKLLMCGGKDLKTCGGVPKPPAEIHGLRRLKVDLTDDDATLKKVAFALEGKALGEVSKAPFELDWDTTKSPEGPGKLTAKVTTTKDEVLDLAAAVTINNCDKDHDGFQSDKACGGDDCDDADQTVYPGAVDPHGDGKDQSCDGKDGVDLDGDGYFDKASGGLDCNDSDKTVHPCTDDKAGDGIDSNCDGKDEASCDDCDTCSVDTQSGDGCLHIPFGEGNPCEDGNPCSSGDKCKGGKCVSDNVKSCDDGNLCTADSCDKDLKCTHAPSAGACFDGNACTLEECKDGKCSVGQQVVCDDGVDCSLDLCDPKTGCYAKTTADGAPCAAGCKIGVCKTGVCEGKTDGIWDKLISGQGRNQGVADAGNGEYWVVGYAIAGLGAQDYIAKIDGAGTVKILKNNTPVPPSFGRISTSVVGDGAGGAVVAAFQPPIIPGLPSGGELVMYSSAGTQTKSVLVASMAQAIGISRSSEGVYLMAGGGNGGGGPGGTQPNSCMVVAFSSSGSTQWTKTLGSTQNGASCWSSEWEDNKHAVVAGGAPNGGAIQGTLARVDAAGNVKWQQFYSTKANSGIFVGLAKTSTGWIAVGSANNPTGQVGAGWMVGVDAAGKQLWNNESFPTGVFWSAVPAGNGVVATGWTGSGTTGANGSVVRVDGLGSVMWQKSLDSGAGDFLTGSIAVPGGFLMVGEKATKTQGAGQRWLLRMDAYGNTTCSASGKCAGLSAGQCEDTNPCTADFCDGTSGCKHSNLADGTSCGGGKACKAGVCQ